MVRMLTVGSHGVLRFAAGFNVRRCGVRKMLQQCGLEFQGREHSGIDDARNIARIAAEMIRAATPFLYNISAALGRHIGS